MEKDTYEDESGYLRYKDTKKLVHRKVAYNEIYLSNEHDYPFSAYQVHHKDGNKQNNAVENLQIVMINEHRALHGLEPIDIIESITSATHVNTVHEYSQNLSISDYVLLAVVIVILVRFLLSIFL